VREERVMRSLIMVGLVLLLGCKKQEPCAPMVQLPPLEKDCTWVWQTPDRVQVLCTYTTRCTWSKKSTTWVYDCQWKVTEVETLTTVRVPCD
jgi:hypothetical protein